jgi:hypothetical protein
MSSQSKRLLKYHQSRLSEQHINEHFETLMGLKVCGRITCEGRNSLALNTLLINFCTLRTERSSETNAGH